MPNGWKLCFDLLNLFTKALTTYSLSVLLTFKRIKRKWHVAKK